MVSYIEPNPQISICVGTNGAAQQISGTNGTAQPKQRTKTKWRDNTTSQIRENENVASRQNRQQTGVLQGGKLTQILYKWYKT